MIVEDDSSVYSHIKEVLNQVKRTIGGDIGIDDKCFTTLEQLKNAEAGLNEAYDLMILDLKLDDNGDNSTETIDQLKKMNKDQFVPAVIYTGYASEIDEEDKRRWKFVKVIEKGSDLNRELENAISELIDIKLKFEGLFKLVKDEFKKISIDTLDEIFESEEQIDEKAVTALMISRLSALLTTRLSDIIKPGDHIPIEAAIVYPPLPKVPDIPISMGDILRDPEGNCWFVATPTCDLVDGDKRKPKVNDVLMLRCFRSPEDMKDYFGRDGRQPSGRDVSSVFRVPRSISESKLLYIDPKLYRTQPYKDVLAWEKVLSISPLYADNVKANFIGDVVRLGTPDTVPSHKDLIDSFFKGAKKRD
ncbi:MAG: hypothetical protein QW292_14935 [Candidatus Parvarchaeota archaeon]